MSARRGVRFGVALAGAGLVWAVSARAGLILQLPAPTSVLHAGDAIVLSGTLYNSGSDSVFLNGATSGLVPLLGADTACDGFLLLGPLALGPGELWSGKLLSIRMDAAADSGLQTYSLTVVGGTTPYDQSLPATAYFTLQLGAGTTAAPAGRPATALKLSATPNPSHGTVTLAFAVSRPTVVRLEIYSVSGQRVRTLASGRLLGGEQRITWDGRNESGSPAAAGVYFARLNAGALIRNVRMVLVR